MGEPRAELSFLFGRKPLGKPFGDEQPQNAIANELKPLV